MEIDRIKNRDSFEAWLLERDGYERIAVNIAARAALRVQPRHWVRLAPDGNYEAVALLQFVWSSLASAVAAKRPSNDVERACAAAASAADNTQYADAAINYGRSSYYDAHAYSYAAAAAINAAAIVDTKAAEAASKAVATAVDAVGEVVAWSVLQEDIKALDLKQNVWVRPLWPARDAFEQDWAKTKAAWHQAGAPWETFANIYDHFWTGLEPDWKTLEQIVLVDPKTWAAGPKAVMQKIPHLEGVRQLDAANPDPRPLSIDERVSSTSASAEIRTQLVSLYALIERQDELVRGDNSLSEEKKASMRSALLEMMKVSDQLDKLSEHLPVTDKVQQDNIASLAKYLAELLPSAIGDASESIDKTIRIALISATCAVLTSFGSPAMIAVLIGTVGWGGEPFGARKLGELWKVIKETK